MRILSWDVGIKNLAYCLIKVKESRAEIEDWGVINLSGQVLYTCGGLKKNQTVCGKKALLLGKCEGTEYSYCLAHRSQYPGPDADSLIAAYEELAKKTIRCGYQTEKSSCAAWAKYRNPETQKCYCRIHRDAEVRRGLKKVELKKIETKSCLSEKISGLSRRLIEALDRKGKKFWQIDRVLIENQPTLKNPTMKTISSFLFSYFMMRVAIDREREISVEFISPSNKLKVNADRSVEVIRKTKDSDPKNVYKMTKALGIEYTKMLLKDRPKWLDHLKEYKKKDDLCDAFLQGYHYLWSRKLVTGEVKEEGKATDDEKNKAKDETVA